MDAHIQNIINKILYQFSNAIIFSSMYRNNNPTYIKLEYYNNFMKIFNLNEFPDLKLEFNLHEIVKPPQIKVKKKSHKSLWYDIYSEVHQENKEKEIRYFEKEVSIYKFLFPHLILPNIKFYLPERSSDYFYDIIFSMDSKLFTFKGSYNMISFLSKEILEYFKPEEMQREISIRISLEKMVTKRGRSIMIPYLVEMEQKDLDPFDDSIILKFDRPMFNKILDLDAISFWSL